MKTILLVLLIFAFSSSALAFDFNNKEEIEYKVTFMGMTVVRAYINGDPVNPSDSGSYRLSIKARTTKFWNMFYPLENYYLTYMDTTGAPLIYRRNINEKSFKNITEQNYDHKLNRIYYEGNTAVDHPGQLENFFSAVYKLRTMPMEIGVIDSFYLNIEKAAWLVIVTVEGNKSINVLDEKTDCFEIDAKFVPMNQTANRLPTDILTNKLVNSGTDLTLFISNDERRVPAKMVYNMTPFDVNVTVTKYSFGESEHNNRK
ncbi:MAG: DUF3108 domain-containing protein [candidate division Zixibacteria bacterium]|nr:DUF3108 domain-containing protein [candidate division Zixibacteria bacterium]